MRNKLKYILGITTVLLSSCVDEGMLQGEFLNGKEKTPIAVSALFDKSSGAVTRATDMAFENNDKLIVYLRHVIWDGTTAGARTSVTADKAPLLVTLTKGSTSMTPYTGSNITPIGTNVALGLTSDNTRETSDLTASPALYWDDFSNSVDADHDLRTGGHYLQSYYGYCYNGGSPTTPLTESTGVLGWSVATDQTSGIKTSDLLWSYEQTPVQYSHETGRAGLVIPYTHAMSKITVEVHCEDGFNSDVDGNFSNALLEITSANTVCTVKAPTATVSGSTTSEKITMQKGTQSSNKKQCTFTAIVAPTLIKADSENPFITLINIDGNDYKVFLTDAVIDAKETGTTTTKSDAWSKQLALYNNTEFTPTTAHENQYSADGGMTMPGVNYHLTVTLKKQTVKVNASIRDWSTVNASTEGEIDLPDSDDHQISDDPIQAGQPIDVKTVDKDKFQTGASFSLFAVKAASEGAAAIAHVNADYKYLTVTSFINNPDDADDLWKNTPEIYWQNNTDNYYFRALAIYNGKNSAGEYLTESVGTYDANQGTHVNQAEKKDYIWATTPRHIGYYSNSTDEHVHEMGAAIPPRKGGVPLAFEHIMTKITFNLVDARNTTNVPHSYTHAGNPLNPYLDLSGAKIQISNLSTEGEITIEDGSITPTTPVSAKIFGDGTGFNPAKLNGEDNTETENLIKEYVVIPQKFGNRNGVNEAMVTITLNNGMTYRVQLKKCLTGTDTDGNPIYLTEWKRGQHYTYTITLAKEGIQFRALVKDWEEITGGGNAEMEW